jgi:hypothetical protein
MKRDGKMRDRLIFFYKKAPAKTGTFILCTGVVGEQREVRGASHEIYVTDLSRPDPKIRL